KRWPAPQHIRTKARHQGRAMSFLIVLLCTVQVASDPAELVMQLGSPRYAEREAAGEALQTLGREALAVLRLATRNADAEVATRATSLLEQIETKLLVEPTMVRVDFRDRPLSEVLKRLGEQTKTTISFTPDINPQISQRKLTFSLPKPIPFWEAIE